MNAAGRLGAYAAVLAVVFIVAFFGAGLVVPDSVVENWTARADEQHHSPPSTIDDESDGDHHGGGG